jgi:myo-inositol-1(or 4)-monophosphatase
MLARRYVGRVAAQRKADRSLVTDADHAVQARILATIAEKYPHHAVLAEEAIPQPAVHPAITDAEFCWIIDPIDGTRNFYRRLPSFTTVVAVARAGRPIAAAIYDPNANELYAAVQGRGATLNGTPISVSDEATSATTLIGVPSSHRRALPPAVHQWLDRWNFRNLGSTALHVALVAAGRLDAAICLECRVWDVAAAWLIAREAGARCTDLAGEDRFPMDLATVGAQEVPCLASRPGMHEKLLATLMSAEDVT